MKKIIFACVHKRVGHKWPLPFSIDNPILMLRDLSFVRVNPSTDAKSILRKEVFCTLRNTTGSPLSHDP
jgi:hypothetical protein